MHPLYHQGCWLLNCANIRRQMFPRLLRTEDQAPIFQRKNFRYGLVRPKNTFPFPLFYLKPFDRESNGICLCSCLVEVQLEFLDVAKILVIFSVFPLVYGDFNRFSGFLNQIMFHKWRNAKLLCIFQLRNISLENVPMRSFTEILILLA